MFFSVRDLGNLLVTYIALLGTSFANELYGAIDARIEILIKSYPDLIRDDKFLLMKDGREFQISDGKVTKTPRNWTFLDSLYARARRRPCVTMFGFSRQGR
jgi:hypothetical protein